MPTLLCIARFSTFGLFIAGLLVGPRTGAQDTVQPKDQKIGLVLEGGAALGLAHIGVLQWLEEHHIPVDYVAGTSMGGLVGGLYATGNSPAGIRQLVDGIDWDVVMRGEVPYQDLSFRRKQDSREFPNSLEFGIKGGLRFPEGFNSGHQVGLILDRAALPYSEVKDFNDLPIPFACVATDLVNNRQHVFRSGSLTQALRSTMSLPGVFTPVRDKENGAVYVDGGLLDNLPVDVAREMGAEMTIAVHLEVKPLGANEPLSSVGVLGRSVSVVIAANELRSMQNADILISVPLAKYTATDYKKSAEIIKLGYEAAESKASVLSRFSVDEETWETYLARRNARKKTLPEPKFVEVEGTSPKLAGDITEQLSNNVGKPIDTNKLENQLTYLTGDERFANIGYQLTDKNGQSGLLIQAREKLYSPPFVRPLIVIDGSQIYQVQFLLGARFTFMDVGSFGSEWRNDVILGSEHGLRSEFYRPFGEKLKWFIAPQAYATNTQQLFFNENTLLAEYRNREAGGAFDFGYAASRSSEVRLGYKANYQKLDPSVGGLIYGTLQGRVGTTSLRYWLEGHDDPIIPRIGVDAFFRSEWNDANPGASSGFPLTELRFSKFFELNEPSSIFFTAAGGTTYTHHKTGFPPFQLGAGPDLYAYGKNEFLTNQYLLFRAGYMHRLFSLPALVGKNMYAVAEFEGAKIYDLPRSISSLPADISLSVVVNTIFGPVLIGGGAGATGHYKFFYSLGRTF
jgi:NTE family protein